MTPTSKLRWINRPIPDLTSHVERVLQQWWEDASTDVYWVNGNPGEWRDIPLEEDK